MLLTTSNEVVRESSAVLAITSYDPVGALSSMETSTDPAVRPPAESSVNDIDPAVPPGFTSTVAVASPAAFPSFSIATSKVPLVPRSISVGPETDRIKKTGSGESESFDSWDSLAASSSVRDEPAYPYAETTTVRSPRSTASE